MNPPAVTVICSCNRGRAPLTMTTITYASPSPTLPLTPSNNYLIRYIFTPSSFFIPPQTKPNQNPLFTPTFSFILQLNPFFSAPPFFFLLPSQVRTPSSQIPPFPGLSTFHHFTAQKAKTTRNRKNPSIPNCSRRHPDSIFHQSSQISPLFSVGCIGWFRIIWIENRN